jgi:addiction module RelB/DinJ family antitoxin
MTEIFRVRIDPKLLKQAHQVTRQMGTSPGELVRMLFTQVVRNRAIPFEVSADGRAEDLLDIKRRNRILLSLDDSEGW